jgi:hypothetical protein
MPWAFLALGAPDANARANADALVSSALFSLGENKLISEARLSCIDTDITSRKELMAATSTFCYNNLTAGVILSEARLWMGINPVSSALVPFLSDANWICLMRTMVTNWPLASDATVKDSHGWAWGFQQSI